MALETSESVSSVGSLVAALGAEADSIASEAQLAHATPGLRPTGRTFPSHVDQVIETLVSRPTSPA